VKQKEFLVIPNESPNKYQGMPNELAGYWWETKNLICVPDIISKEEGKGNFSKWLTELEAKGKIIFFPTIVSARLDAILRARGYIDAVTEYIDENFGCHIFGLAKRGSNERTRKED
jgi:hypothetical protein